MIAPTIAFNFTEVFSRIGRVFVSGLRRRMLSQVGIDGEHYSRPKLSTLKGRRGRKTAPKSVSIMRLVVTRRLANNSFRSSPTANGVRLYVSGSQGGVPHNDIIAFNQRGTGVTNPHIERPPLVFPNTVGEVSLMSRELGQSWDLFVTDVDRQLKAKAIMKLKTELKT